MTSTGGQFLHIAPLTLTSHINRLYGWYEVHKADGFLQTWKEEGTRQFSGGVKNLLCHLKPLLMIVMSSTRLPSSLITFIIYKVKSPFNNVWQCSSREWKDVKLGLGCVLKDCWMLFFSSVQLAHTHTVHTSVGMCWAHVAGIGLRCLVKSNIKCPGIKQNKKNPTCSTTPSYNVL